MGGEMLFQVPCVLFPPSCSTQCTSARSGPHHSLSPLERSLGAPGSHLLCHLLQEAFPEFSCYRETPVGVT